MLDYLRRNVVIIQILSKNQQIINRKYKRELEEGQEGDIGPEMAKVCC